MEFRKRKPYEFTSTNIRKDKYSEYIYSDQGANFESNSLIEMCGSSWINKTHAI